MPAWLHSAPGPTMLPPGESCFLAQMYILSHQVGHCQVVCPSVRCWWIWLLDMHAHIYAAVLPKGLWPSDGASAFHAKSPPVQFWGLGPKVLFHHCNSSCSNGTGFPPAGQVSRVWDRSICSSCCSCWSTKLQDHSWVVVGHRKLQCE